MKIKYKVLGLLKKIKKNGLYSALGTLNSEKKKLSKINHELKQLVDESSFKAGDELSSSQLKNNSYFRQNLSEKIEISSNRETHLDKEILGYVGQISKVKKQQEIIKKKIDHDLILKQNEKEQKNTQNYTIKSFL